MYATERGVAYTSIVYALDIYDTDVYNIIIGRKINIFVVNLAVQQLVHYTIA